MTTLIASSCKGGAEGQGEYTLAASAPLASSTRSDSTTGIGASATGTGTPANADGRAGVNGVVMVAVVGLLLWDLLRCRGG